ncbi:uncharacterized protein LOC135172851 [Diachasmimorpha longicaudata]|uniref:uncharacterized protein LOC135172851 n=1 Tax=Diachasmimorpha longicaudata TaxID=58733 RepID=UPI0030B8DFBC
MDPASVITLCKENIQPLRHGRNATQLGTALRAQEDAEAQQLLLQEKQKYEDAIKNYEGDDPLEMWYEYILWVEQSYPKSGHESHIGKLLQQCLAAFEKETKYHQDRRYIRLWINYISMQKNPLELYQLLYNNGIGTMVADMYRAWAFELEQVNDNKRADEVYDLGIRAGAEPRDELNHAHANFQFAVARKTLGRMEERNEISLLEQRQAFSSLRAIKSGRRATHVRTGQRVRDYQPGVVPQGSQVQIGKGNAKIQIYEDEPAPLEHRGASILDHVPIEEAVHKENTIKAGPWSNAARKHPLIPPTAKTSFKIHEDRADGNFDMEKLHLYPNHVTFFDGSNYPEHKTVPVFVPEQPSAIVTKTFYPKDLVYANNMDRSMEEIRAERYFKQRRMHEKMYYENSEGLMNGRNMQPPNDMERRNFGNEEMERLKFEVEQKREKERLEAEQREMERRQAEQMEMERQRLEEMERQRLAEMERLRREEIERQRREEMERQRREEMERQRRDEIERQRREEMERQRQEEMERQRREEIERQRIEAERIEAERIESQRMEAELSGQRKLPQNYLHHTSANSSLDPSMEHLLGQSITVNTKEAMSVVQDLWHSPNDTGSPIVPTPIQHRMADSRAKFSFDIHMDSSMTQNVAMSSSKHHNSYIPPYHDQENQFAAGFSQNHHQSFRNHGIPDPYQYQTHQVQMQSPGISPMHMMQSPQIHHSVQHHYSQQIQSPQIPHHQSPHMHNLQSPHQHHQPHHHQPVQNHHHQPHPPHHASPHQPHQQHHQSQVMHHMYNNMHQGNVRYTMQQQHQQQPQQQQQHEQQYPIMQSPQQPQDHIDPRKRMQFQPFVDIQGEGKSYRMPELPYIKSPGMNRRDLKYLDSTDNKENASAAGYSSGLEDKQDNLFIDESLGIAPLNEVDDTCFTDGFSGPLTSSTPMTNQFRPSTCRNKDTPQYQVPQVHLNPPVIPEIQTQSDPDEKLSVIMESTREYISSSSGSSVRTGGFGFATREDLGVIQEQSTQDIDSTETLLGNHNSCDQSLRAKIQVVDAQSPRTVQRNVDHITSEINHCDLRKPLNLDGEVKNEKKNEGKMECSFNEPMEEVEEEEFVLPTGDINPFDKTLISGLLRKAKFPRVHHSNGYHRMNMNLNKMQPSSVVNLGTDTYELEKTLGKGTYGTVMKALCIQTGQAVALKTQRPAWVWEYYIAREIKSRITNPHMLRGFMDISKAYVTNNASVLVSEYSKYGTLLSVTNQVKVATGKPLTEALSITFTLEMLQIVEYLHKCQIIHGDIKPDNFLLMHLPTEDVRPTIQLIDFGCSIDMSLFPEGTKFTQMIKTEDFTCIEMQTGRPWTYQTDLYCLAASAHCLLLGNYMKVIHTGEKWFITAKMPRYVKRAAWETFFTELLNIESCDKMPDLSALRSMMEEALANTPNHDSQFRNFANVLNGR